MVETSPVCFSKFSSLATVPLRRAKEFVTASFPSTFANSVHPLPTRSFRTSTNASNTSGSTPNDDPFGFIPPWLDDQNGIEWVQEERVTLFTADGLVQIGGSVVPRLVNSSRKPKRRSDTSPRYLRYQESDYMDPNQGLCLGALFNIAATNGLDTGRRLCILGFCRSVEMLSDVVEDTVLEHGGEVVVAETAVNGGLHEKLTMTVAVPYLWGIPPASETLKLAVHSGGGIVDKVYWQWNFM